MGTICHSKSLNHLKSTQSYNYNDNEEIFYLSKKIERNPQNFLLIEKLGCMLFSKRNYEQAEILLMKTYKNNYKTYEILFILGNIMEIKGDIQKAIAFYEECLTMNHKYLGCLKKLIEMNLTLNKFEESIRYCMIHLNLNDRSAEVHTYLAINLINKKKLQKAYEHIQISMELDPNNSRTLNSYGNILKKMGRREESINFYMKAIENSQSMSQEYKSIIHFNLGIVLFHCDKIFFGLKELDRSLIIDIKIGDIMIKKGFHLFLKDRDVFKAVLAYYEKDYKNSKYLLEKSQKIDQKNFVIYYYLGEIAEKLLQIPIAIKFFQKSIRKITKSQFNNSFVAKIYSKKIREKSTK